MPEYFPTSIAKINLDDLCSDNGVPASATWFSDSGRRSEKVYVASAFGLTVGILRQKSLADVQFIRLNEFLALAAWINAFDLNRNEVQPFRSIECRSQKAEPEIIPPSDENLVQGNGNNESLAPTPPMTPSPPNSKSVRAAILHVPAKTWKEEGTVRTQGRWWSFSCLQETKNPWNCCELDGTNENTLWSQRRVDWIHSWRVLPTHQKGW